MDRLPYGPAPRWWSPLLAPRIMRVMRGYTLGLARRKHHLADVEVRGLEHVRPLLDQNHGVMICSKHVGHVDAFVFLAAGDQLRPFYFMAGWEVFQLLKPLERRVLRWHGTFSIDRESNDLRAFRQAVDILQTSRHPLVMFPEGEIYHNNEWVVPFRSGVAAIALAAARRAQRPISCVPAAIKYEYATDPTPDLLRLMDRLERQLLWQPRTDLPLPERLRRLAEGVIALRELEYVGEVQRGPLPGRIASLAEAVLRRVEERQGARPGGNLPERLTALKQQAVKKREGLPADDPQVLESNRDLEDLFVALQLYSYTQDYTPQEWSLERTAEILDKFEEDVLGAPTATYRGQRRAIIAFGAPIEVKSQKRKKDEAQALTATLEQAVREVLNGIYGRNLEATGQVLPGTDP